MILAVWLPFLVPLLAVPVARRVAPRLAPRTAAWLLLAGGVTLALCSTVTLLVVVASALLQFGPMAALAGLPASWLNGYAWLTVPVGWVATPLLVAGTLRLVRVAARQTREVRTARAEAGPVTGELAVRTDEHPYAYALPGGRRERHRIVVSSGMLRALQPAEREALFAHERAHLTGGHHHFLRLSRLMRILHPSLRGLHEPLVYALERWADECAADAVGDRRLAARAVARAALVAKAFDGSAPRPGTALGVTSGPVPRRVAALLAGPGEDDEGRPNRSSVPAWLALAAAVAVTAYSAEHAVVDLDATIRIAQYVHGLR